MTTVQPIQIVGTQRSGSNLLRLMLNQYPEITAPHPPHILQRFMPLLPLYNPLSEDRHFLRLIDDVCTLVEYNPVPWSGMTFDRTAIYNQCRSHSLIEIFKVIHDLKALHDQASFWVCKSMANVAFASEMEANGMQPLYIHLYRDGRDVACSFKKAIVGEKHVYHIANQWRNNQEACLALQRKTNPDRIIQVSYENLLNDPEKEMKRISVFLGIPFRPDVLDFFKSRESENTANAGRMWANVSRPLLKNNTRKYQTGLTEMEIAIFEKQAGETLKELGYKLQNQVNGSSDFSSDQIKAFDEENQFLKTKSIELADPEDLKLRAKQTELLNQIKNR